MATYRLTLKNPGTTPAKNVKVYATVPIGGTLLLDGANASYDRQYDRVKRRLLWTISQLEQGVPIELSFSVRLGGVQLYQATAEARAEAPIFLTAKSTCSTDVKEMADVDFQVVEIRRVVDVGEEFDYEIRIKNRGSKEATQLLITARVSEQLEVRGTIGLGEDEHAHKDPTSGREMTFPIIDRLGPRSELVRSFA